MTSHPIDIVASEVTFTDPQAALAALRRRAPEAAAPVMAEGARTLQQALRAFDLELLGEQSRACRLKYAGDAYRPAVMECALEAIAPHVDADSIIVGRCTSGSTWRWTFTGDDVARERGSLAFMPADASWHATLTVHEHLSGEHSDALMRQLAVALVGCGIREFDLRGHATRRQRHARRIVGDRTLVGPGGVR